MIMCIERTAIIPIYSFMHCIISDVCQENNVEVERATTQSDTSASLQIGKDDIPESIK